MTRYSLFFFLVIPFMDVYKKSACKTREVLVDIIQEYPDEIEHTYIPSCVVLTRCAGCCNDEALECVPTETRNVTMEVRPVQSSAHNPSPCLLWLHTCPAWGQWGGINWHVSYVVYRCTLCLLRSCGWCYSWPQSRPDLNKGGETENKLDESDLCC